MTGTTDMRIRTLDVPRCTVGESLVWDVGEQALYFVDVIREHWDEISD